MRLLLILSLLFTISAEIIKDFKFELIEVLKKDKCTKDPLTCWLENLVFKIPDTCFMVENTECCITNFICDGIQLGGINSAYNSPASFFFELEDLGTKCSGQWKYGRLGGTLSATISNTDISTTAVVGKNDIYPNSLVFPSCAVPNINIDLKFSGGLVGFILQLISSIVESGLEKAIYTLFCEKAEPTISLKMTEALVTKIDPALQTLVSYGPSIPPSFPENTYIDWSSSLPGLLEKVEDKFANDYLNKIIDTLTGGTGIIKVNLHNTTMEWPVIDPTAGPLGTIKLILHNLEVSGLDTFYDISLLTPSDPSFVSYSPYSIWSTFSMHSIGISIDATIDVSLDQGSLQGGELKESFTLKLEVSDTKFGADVLIPVNIERFNNLYLNQVFDISCLLSTADALSISSLIFDTHIESMKVIQTGSEGSLEQDIDALINNIVELGVKDFPELLSGSISGVFQGPLRSLINKELSDILLSSSSKCVPHITTDDGVEPDYVVWSESAGLEELDYLLNTMFGVTGVNELITSVTGGSGSITIPLSIADIAITLFGLNTFYKFSLITPSLDTNKPYNLDSDLALGYCEGHSRNQKCTPVGLSLILNSNTNKNTDKNIITNIITNINTNVEDLTSSSLSVNFYNFDITSSLLAKFNKNNLYDIQVSDLFIYTGNHSGCFLSSFDNLAIDTLSMSISEAKLTKGALVSKDITDQVEKLLNVITNEEAIGAVNKVLSQLLEDAGVACESGSWPIHDDDDNNGNDDDPTKDCEGPVQCGLNKVVIGPFPDLCVDIKEGMIGLCIEKLSCYNLDVVGIESNNVNPQTLRVGVDKFAITCGADISLNVNPSGSSKSIDYHGSFSISMTNFSGLVDMVFGSSVPSSIYPPLPNSLHFTNCHTSETNFKVKFEGGVIGTILNKVLGPPISEALESAVYWALCDVLNPVLGHVISKVLKDKVDPAIKNIIDKSVIPSPVIMPGYLEWNETIIGKFHNIIDFMKANEGKVLRCMIGDKSPLDGYNINSLINMMTDNTGEFDIYLNIPISIGEVTLTLEILTISGLNTIGDLFLLNPISGSGVTLSSSFELSSLDFQLTVMLRENSGKYEQEAVLDLKLENVTLGFDIVAAMRLSLLNNLYSDQILHLPCLMSTLDEFYLSSLLLKMNIDNLSINQISGGDATELEEDIAVFINDLFDLLLEGYPLMVTDIIEGIFQGPIKEKINDKLEESVLSYKNSHVCNEHGNYTNVNWIEWIDSNLIEKVDVILNDILGSDGLNQFIDCVTDNTGKAVINIPPTSAFLGGFTITLGGLDSFSDFALIYPISDEPYDLGNSLGLGSCPSSTNCNSFYLSLEGDVDSRHVSIKLTIENLLMYLDLLMELDMSAFKNLRYKDIHTSGCAVSTMDALALNSLDISLGGVELYLQDGEKFINLTSLVTKLVSDLNDGILVQKINTKLSETLVSSTDSCQGNIVPDGDSGSSPDSSNAWRWQLAVLITGCIIALGILIWIYFKYGVAGMSKTCLIDGKEVYIDENTTILTTPAPTGIFSNYWFSRKIGGLMGYGDDFVYDALIAQDRIYVAVRLLIPLALLGNFALFLNSNIAVGASVMAELDIGSKVITPDPVFEFGLANTVRDMWDAGVYPLSILVAFFSGAWPYVKLTCMFLSWILPTSLLKEKHRDNGLIWLDILGKWSLIDAYVMVLMMVAFNFTLVIASGLQVIVYVVPGWGFYGFLLATMCSLGLGHLVLACHRLIAETKIPPQDVNAESMMNHKFNVHVCYKEYDRSDPSITKKVNVWKPHVVTVTLFGKIAMVILLLLVIFTVIAGTFKLTFQFEIKGLTGYLLGNDANSPYSLVSVGTMLPEASGSPHSFGIRWIQAAYLAFGLGFPLAFLVSLIFLWITPLTMKFQKSLVVATEVMNAWSALDVFVVSIVASLLEIQQFAAFIVGDNCDQINKILEEYMDDKLNGDDVCFDVIATLTNNAWMIYLSAGFLIIVGLPCMSLCHKVVAERMDEYERRMNKFSEERISIGSNRQRSTSMSSLRPTVSLLATTLEKHHNHQSHNNEAENNTQIPQEEEEVEESRPVLSSVDLNVQNSNHQGSTLSSFFGFSARSDVVPIVGEDHSDIEGPKDTWLNHSCSYFVRACHYVKLISMEDF